MTILRKSRSHRKVQLQNLSYGSYNIRVGQLWDNGSSVIVIHDIFKHVCQSNEWVEVRFRLMDALEKEYASERFIYYIEKNKFVPIQ